MIKDFFSSLLGKDTLYKGVLTSKGTTHINGSFVGDVSCEGKLIIGKDANVKGTISVKEVAIYGTVTADIRVSECVSLHKTARVYGNISAPSIAMEHGAVFQGEISMPEISTSSTSIHALTRQHCAHIHNRDVSDYSQGISRELQEK